MPKAACCRSLQEEIAGSPWGVNLATKARCLGHLAGGMNLEGERRRHREERGKINGKKKRRKVTGVLRENREGVRIWWLGEETARAEQKKKKEKPGKIEEVLTGPQRKGKEKKQREEVAARSFDREEVGDDS